MSFDQVEYERKLKEVFSNGNPIQKAVILICGKRNGLTLRAMARMVSLSDGTVRNLISLRQLPFADQSQIAAGASYRSYLTKVRDIKVERKESKQTRKELARVRAGERGTKTLRDFFHVQNLGSGYCERVLLDAQGFIRHAEDKGVLKSGSVVWSGSASQTFTACKPDNFDETTGVERINCYILWVCRVLVRLIPDSAARELAINGALDRPLSLGV